MGVLSEKESEIVSVLRFPLIRTGTPTRAEYLSMLTDKEILELFEKMDSYIDEEGKIRCSCGSYDEMYVVELTSVKNILKSEYEKRTSKKGKNLSILGTGAEQKDFICDICGKHFLGYANRYAEHMKIEHGVTITKIDEQGEEFKKLN